MKRVFVFSFLGLISVIPSSYGWGTNYNIATVQYVKEQTLSRDQLLPTGVTLVNSNQANDHVPSVKRMEEEIDNAVANKVDKTAVISSTGTVTSDDTQIPTVKRMESEIEDALGWVKDTVVAIDQGAEKKDQILVTDSVGAVKTVPQIGMEQVADLEGALNSKVANEQIVATPGGNSMVDYAASLQAGAEADEDMVSAVPSVNAVAESFVPNEAVDYYNGAIWGNSETMQEPGAYLLMVIVDENGNKSYRWVATQIGLYDTSAGQIAG